MDAFFASVEQRDEPSLRGRPVLVGGTGNRGVVCAASYEARPFGCRSAMPMSVARRLCPHAVVVPVRGRVYGQVSEQVFAILGRFTPLVQKLSVDEAFLDVTGSVRLFGDGVAIARRIRQLIREETQLTASVGVSHNKFLAKLASDLNKPDGLTVFGHEQVRTLLPTLGVERLWGVGPKAQKRLADLNIKTIGDLQCADEKLISGRFGEHLRRLALGLDDRPVHPGSERKGISHEQTFNRDVPDRQRLLDVLLGQTQAVARRLRARHLQARRVTIKLRYGNFVTITRSVTLSEATDVTLVLWRAAEALFLTWAQQDFQPIRLIGVAAQQLQGAGQMGLFVDELNERHKRVDAALDAVAEKLGPAAVRRGFAVRTRRESQL